MNFACKAHSTCLVHRHWHSQVCITASGGTREFAFLHMCMYVCVNVLEGRCSLAEPTLYLLCWWAGEGKGLVSLAYMSCAADTSITSLFLTSFPRMRELFFCAYLAG